MQPPTGTDSQHNNVDTATKAHTTGDRITGPADHSPCRDRPRPGQAQRTSKRRQRRSTPWGRRHWAAITASATEKPTQPGEQRQHHRGPRHRGAGAPPATARLITLFAGSRPRSSQAQREQRQPSKKINPKGPRPHGHDHHQSIERAPGTHRKRITGTLPT